MIWSTYGHFKIDRLQIIVVAKKYICVVTVHQYDALKCVQFHNWFQLH